MHPVARESADSEEVAGWLGLRVTLVEALGDELEAAGQLTLAPATARSVFAAWFHLLAAAPAEAIRETVGRRGRGSRSGKAVARPPALGVDLEVQAAGGSRSSVPSVSSRPMQPSSAPWK